ncbi:spore germination protein [Priestia aryabhattai]|uniref:spore germination protein n=1 Tax=Priestia aryabhattai TaxID=412384 RepID=UPI003D2953B5
MRQRYLLKSPNKEKTTACSATPLYDDVNKNIERLLNELGNSSDVLFRMVESPYPNTLKAAIIHLDGLADENIINENIITPLIQWLKESNQVATVEEIEEQIPQMLTVSQLTTKENWHEFMSAVLIGDTVILMKRMIHQNTSIDNVLSKLIG